MSDKRTTGDPRVDPYCLPFMVAMRNDTAVCIDLDCSLSGGYAHAGPCEPCDCGLKHAISECPERQPEPDTCARCHRSCHMELGDEPTKYCNPCAHALLSQLELALGFDQPWPVQDVLKKLADAVDHLLVDHGCDAHGWEELHRARDEARKIAAAVVNADWIF